MASESSDWDSDDAALKVKTADTNYPPDQPYQTDKLNEFLTPSQNPLKHQQPKQEQCSEESDDSDIDQVENLRHYLNIYNANISTTTKAQETNSKSGKNKTSLPKPSTSINKQQLLDLIKVEQLSPAINQETEMLYQSSSITNNSMMALTANNSVVEENAADSSDDESSDDIQAVPRTLAAVNYDKYIANRGLNKFKITKSFDFNQLSNQDEIFMFRALKKIKSKHFRKVVLSTKESNHLAIKQDNFNCGYVKLPKKLMILCRRSNSFELTTLNVKGTFTLLKQQKESTEDLHDVKPNHINNDQPIIFPSGLKLRHPLYGADFESKINLSQNTLNILQKVMNREYNGEQIESEKSVQKKSKRKSTDISNNLSPTKILRLNDSGTHCASNQKNRTDNNTESFKQMLEHLNDPVRKPKKKRKKDVQVDYVIVQDMKPEPILNQDAQGNKKKKHKRDTSFDDIPVDISISDLSSIQLEMENAMFQKTVKTSNKKRKKEKLI